MENKKFEMHQVDVKCSECGAQITELPFEPAPDRPVYCRECNYKRKIQRNEQVSDNRIS